MERRRAVGHERLDVARVDLVVEACARLTAARDDPPRMLLVLLAEEGTPDIEALVEELRAARPTVPFLGGVFPSLIDGEEKLETGALVLALPVAGRPMVITGLDAETVAIPEEFGADAAGTAIVLVDGLARSIAGLLEGIYDRLGNSVAYWGGGAGSARLERRPCLFCDQGVYLDAAVVAFTPLEARLGVRHGWTERVGPFVASRTHHNRILELNWEPAFEVYAAAVVDVGEPPLTRAGFFRDAKGFPFGLQKQGAEPVVRDPIAVDDEGALVCVGEVSENAALSILEGDPARLIAAARGAVEDACGDACEERLALVADCVSRELFLEGRFREELAAMHQAAQARSGSVRQLGMLTLGEISSSGEGYLELFNKTAVVASFVLDARIEVE